jgi:hypothetical protein
VAEALDDAEELDMTLPALPVVCKDAVDAVGATVSFGDATGRLAAVNSADRV